MSKLTRLVLAALLVELVVAAIFVPSMRWEVISENLSGAAGARRLDTVRLAITLAAPLVLAAAWMAMERRLRASDTTLSPPHRGYAEAGLLTAAFFLMAYQGWFANHLGESTVAHAGQEHMLRAGTIFAGLVMAIHGNFAAKTPAPTGPRAPDPAVWTKVKSRSGWVLSLAGLMIAVCAIVLPPPALLFPFALVAVSAITYAAVQNRALRAAPLP
ncbi:hypothetical protein [Caulobacter sp. LjRoot300]|uniref:hypothetical protein n=1 Tax=Caulobacter sp. LjRoot300 TaxID=3342321 RepID=UPI003ECEB9D1